MSRHKRSESNRPLGRLRSGEAYYAPVGSMLYDGDRVCCHSSGRWLELVGGRHVIAAYGITVEQYREMFRLFGNGITARARRPS